MEAMEVLSKDAESSLMRHLAEQSECESPLCNLKIHQDATTCPQFVHRGVLSATSHYFHQLTNCTFKDAKITDFSLPVDLMENIVDDPIEIVTVLRTVLGYMYGRNLRLRPETVTGVLLLSDYLCIDDLKQRCQALLYANLVPTSALHVFQLSASFSFDNLASTALMMLTARFQDVFLLQADSIIQALTIEHLRMLLPNYAMRHTTTETRLDLLIRWTTGDLESHIEHFADLVLLWEIPKEQISNALLSFNVPLDSYQTIIKTVDPNEEVPNGPCEVEGISHEPTCQTLIAFACTNDYEDVDYGGFIFDPRSMTWKKLPLKLTQTFSQACDLEHTTTVVDHEEFYFVRTLFRCKGMDIWYYSHQNGVKTSYCLKKALKSSDYPCPDLKDLDSAGLETAGRHGDILYGVYTFRDIDKSRYSEQLTRYLMTFTHLPIVPGSCNCRAFSLPFGFKASVHRSPREPHGLSSVSIDDYIFVLGYSTTCVSYNPNGGQYSHKLSLLRCHFPTIACCEFPPYTTSPYVTDMAEISDVLGLPCFSADSSNRRLLVLFSFTKVVSFSLETLKWTEIVSVRPNLSEITFNSYAISRNKDNAVNSLLGAETDSKPYAAVNPFCQTSKCDFRDVLHFYANPIVCLKDSTVTLFSNLTPHASCMLRWQIGTDEWEEMPPPPTQSLRNLSSVEVPTRFVAELPVAKFKSLGPALDCLRSCCPVSESYEASTVLQSTHLQRLRSA